MRPTAKLLGDITYLAVTALVMIMAATLVASVCALVAGAGSPEWVGNGGGVAGALLGLALADARRRPPQTTRSDSDNRSGDG